MNSTHGMRWRSLTISELSKTWLKTQGITQGLLYYWDHIKPYHDNVPSPQEIEIEQLYEAYWFGEKAVVHLYRQDKGWQAISYTETMDEEYVDERQFIQRDRDFGEALDVRSYFEADEDGQLHIVYTRPLRLLVKSEKCPKGGESHD